ncbi:cytochrome-b5 reductase [Nematocida ausubeli]|nr:cytochrome-b5 reductase [Nematocida ausubeli]
MVHNELIEKRGIIKEIRQIGISLCTYLVDIGEESFPPLCYAIRLGIVGKTLTRPYSPVSFTGSTVECIIKIYPQEEGKNMFTPDLEKLSVGDELRVLWYTPKYPIEEILSTKHMHVCMISAGTGITPMMQILDYAAQNRSMHKFTSIALSHSTNHQILKDSSLYSGISLECISLMSKNPDCTHAELIRKIEVLIQPLLSKDVLYLVCGPDSFVEAVSGVRKGEYGGLLMRHNVPSSSCYKF